MNEIWVIAEQRLGKLQKVSCELLGKGVELAQKLKVELAAVLFGENVRKLADELISCGADKVYVADNPGLRLYQCEIYADLLEKIINIHKPQIILISATNIGRDLAPRVAAKLKTGLTAHCVELSISDEGGEKPQLVQVVPGWGGNMMVKIACPVRRPQIATVRPGIMAQYSRTEGKGEIINLSVNIPQKRRVETLEIVQEKSSELPLEEAEVVVAGGWGLSCINGIELIEELAKVLGGVVAGTRPALDAGWIPEHRMIGQSGKTVSPKLFISIGASGAPQFITGFTKAKVVLAIDQNPKAPIFDAADIGLVGDLREIVPCLITELKEAGLSI